MKKKILSLFMVMALACSMMVTSLAADAYSYAYVEIGAAEVDGTLEVGDTVKIPMYVQGLEEGQYASGFCFYYKAVGSLELVDLELGELEEDWFSGYNDVAGATYTLNGNTYDSVTSWSAVRGFFNAINGSYTSDPASSVSENGALLLYFVCEVTEEIGYSDATSGVEVTYVSMAGSSSTDILNSTDGTTNNDDTEAVSYPTDENGNTYYGLMTPDEPIDYTGMYTLVATASEETVVLDQTFTVEISVESTESFSFAEYMLSYDPALFTLVDADVNEVVSSTEDTYHDLYLDGSKEGTAGGTVIATYTFKAIAQDANNVTGSFTLDDDTAFVESYSTSVSGASIVVETTDDSVTIVYSDALSADAYADYTDAYGNAQKGVAIPADGELEIEYTGEAATVYVKTNDDDAIITYYVNGVKVDGEPELTEQGTYVVTYTVEKKGYETVSETVTLIINAPSFVWEYQEYVGGYNIVLVYSNVVFSTDEKDASYTYDGIQMYDVSEAGYLYNDTVEYGYVYALVVDGYDDDEVQIIPVKDSIIYSETEAPAVTYSENVNNDSEGVVDARDIVATQGVYNADSAYMTIAMMEVQLLADVNHSKDVTTADVNSVKSVYLGTDE